MFLLALIIGGCGDGGGVNATGSDESLPAGSESIGADTAHAGSLAAPSVVAGFPAMVDQQGVFINAVKAVPGMLYAAYIQTGSPYLMLARSENNGASWTRSIVDFGGVNASLAVDGNNVYVSYIDQCWNTLKFARSGDQGTTWSITEVDDSLKSDPATRPPVTDPTQPPAPDGFKYTAMAWSGNSFFVAYQDRLHATLRLASSSDGGVNWVCTTLDSSNTSDGDSPAITLDGTNIYVSYVGQTGQGATAYDSIYMMVSHDAGVTWTKRTVAAKAYATGYYTSVAASGAKVYVSYFNALESRLKLAKSGNYGVSWANTTVDPNSNVGRYSSLLLASGVMYLSYSDWTDNGLKVARSTNGGATWTRKTVASDANLGCPSAAAVLGTDLYLLYFHYTPAQPATTGAMLTKIA
jgi:hypothetical protein